MHFFQISSNSTHYNINTQHHNCQKKLSIFRFPLKAKLRISIPYTLFHASFLGGGQVHGDKDNLAAAKFVNFSRRVAWKNEQHSNT